MLQPQLPNVSGCWRREENDSWAYGSCSSGPGTRHAVIPSQAVSSAVLWAQSVDSGTVRVTLQVAEVRSGSLSVADRGLSLARRESDKHGSGPFRSVFAPRCRPQSPGLRSAGNGTAHAAVRAEVVRLARCRDRSSSSQWFAQCADRQWFASGVRAGGR